MITSLTIVTVLSHAAPAAEMVQRFVRALAPQVRDLDIVLVANALPPPEALALKALVQRVPDLSVVFLGTAVHDDQARLVGIEHAVGDHVLFCDMVQDDPGSLPPLLIQAGAGYDVVIADDGAGSAAPGRAFRAYRRLYAAMTGVTLEHRPTGLRLFSRAAALFVAGRPHAELLLSARSIGHGFPVGIVTLPPSGARAAAPGRSWAAALGMLLSVSAIPLRGATYAALVGGVGSVLYSLYVAAVFLLKPDVAPGWTTISLQLAAMMFIFSLILLFIGEYIIQIHAASPPRNRRYLVLRELRSPRSRRDTLLNIIDDEGRFQLGRPDRLLDAADVHA